MQRQLDSEECCIFASFTQLICILEPNEAVNYPSEFLNSIDLSGFPPHALQLKIGVPIILLRNINPPKLCNGTRIAVKKNNGTAKTVVYSQILRS